MSLGRLARDAYQSAFRALRRRRPQIVSALHAAPYPPQAAANETAAAEDENADYRNSSDHQPRPFCDFAWGNRALSLGINVKHRYMEAVVLYYPHM